MQASLRTIRLWTAAAVIPFALGACANMADIPPGTSLAEITAQFGEPNYACTNRNGQQRVIWTTQPMGQYAWGANIDSAGNADQVTPLLTTQHFRKLDEGTWTQEQVHCEFG